MERHYGRRSRHGTKKGVQEKGYLQCPYVDTVSDRHHIVAGHRRAFAGALLAKDVR